MFYHLGLTPHVVPLRLDQPYWPHTGTAIVGSSATTHVNARDREHARLVVKQNTVFLILNLLLEPTVLPPAFLALCSTIILHRFASPAWWEHLKKHISAKLSSEEAFDRVVTLKVGYTLS